MFPLVSASYAHLLRNSSPATPTFSAEDIALGYKQLLVVERGWRDMKQVLDLRPVYHRKEERMCAHVLLCWLALLLVRVAERQTGTTWRQLVGELGRLHLVTLAGPEGRAQHTTRLTDTQRAIYQTLKVAPPPPVTTLDPA